MACRSTGDEELAELVERLYPKVSIERVIDWARADERMRRDVERAVKRHGRGMEGRR